MALTFVRHTRPAIADGICYGQTDLALAKSFETEASDVLARVGQVSRIMTSPLLRCRALAEKLGRAKGVPVEVDDLWIEMDFGTWEGVPWAKIPRAELDGWAADFMDYDGHGGERVSDLHARVGTGLQALVPGALVVTHAGVLKSVRAHLGHAQPWDSQTEFGGVLCV